MTLARTAGAFYLVTFVAGSYALASGGNTTANFIATVSYVVVTLLFYPLFRPVSKPLSALAACVSLSGLALAAMLMFRLPALRMNPLVFFGFYCLLIGYLVFRSEFMPRALGVLLMFGGVGWLTFASATLSAFLSPYNFAPGIVAEGVLTIS